MSNIETLRDVGIMEAVFNHGEAIPAEVDPNTRIVLITHESGRGLAHWPKRTPSVITTEQAE